MDTTKRDNEWREAADRYFDGIQPDAKLIPMYEGGRASLPVAIMHEIWKRQPRTEELERQIKEQAATLSALSEMLGCPAEEIVEKVRELKAEVESYRSHLVKEALEQKPLAIENIGQWIRDVSAAPESEEKQR